MRTRTCLLAALLVAVCVPAALADDEPTPLKPVPDDHPSPAAPAEFRVPPFGMDHIAPAEGALPEGWTSVTASGVVPDTAPSAKALLDLATGAGLDAAKIKARCMPLSKGAGEAAVHGVAGWLVVDADPTPLMPKLEETAKANGWVVKPVGIPVRFLVTWGSTAEAATALQTWQVEVAVRQLCEKGFATIASAGQEFDPNAARKKYMQGQFMVQMAGKTEPEAGIFHALMARFAEQHDPAAALEHNRKALKDGAPVPAPDRWIVIAAFQAGQALLLKEDASVLQEALAMLERGVAAEAKAENHMQRFGNRYNLACTYARIGKKDEAFTHLEESLRYMKNAWVEDKKKSFSGMSQLGYPNHYDHAKTVDPDMAPLRDDPRWAVIMAKYDPEAKPEPKPEPEPKKDGEEKKAGDGK